jgi:hypothetical protein
MGTGGFPPGVKRPEHEVDHSSPTSAEIKKTWINKSTSPYIFMAEHRENLNNIIVII